MYILKKKIRTASKEWWECNRNKLFWKENKSIHKVQVFSYQVAEIIAPQMKPRTIAESLILPVCYTIARTSDVAQMYPMSLNCHIFYASWRHHRY